VQVTIARESLIALASPAHPRKTCLDYYRDDGRMHSLKWKADKIRPLQLTPSGWINCTQCSSFTRKLCSAAVPGMKMPGEKLSYQCGLIVTIGCCKSTNAEMMKTVPTRVASAPFFIRIIIRQPAITF